MDFWIIHAQENPARPRDEAGRRQWRSNTLAETLADRGHNVTRWRSSFSHQAKEQLTQGSKRLAHDNYHQHFIYGPSYTRHVGLARVRHHRALGRNFVSLAGEYERKPDLIHVCNVPIELCEAAVEFGTRHKIPVVIDVRDLWPDVYLEAIPGPLSFLRPLVSAYFENASFGLKRAFRRADAITALTGSYLDWGLRKAGRARHEHDAIFPMSYPKVETDVQPSTIEALRTLLGLAPDDKLACYFGNIGYQSDFDCALKAARLLENRAPQIKFIIAGSGPREDELRAKAKDQANVIFPGWLDGSDLQALMSISTFGLVIYKPVTNFLLNLPNKVAEYLAGGQVMVAGLEGEIGTLVRESGSGFVYPAGDAEALASELERLSASPETLSAMREAAFKAHQDRFEGTGVNERFAQYLEEMALRATAKQPKGTA